MTSLRSKRALVVGASSGIGKATVLALLAEGAHVTAVARGADGLRALAAGARDALATLAGDATDPALAERLVRELRGSTPSQSPAPASSR